MPQPHAMVLGIQVLALPGSVVTTEAEEDLLSLRTPQDSARPRHS